MNIKDQHNNDKPVSALSVFKGSEGGNTVAMQILKGQQLKEHVSQLPAFLLCVSGEALYEDEKGFKATLQSGDYVTIAPQVKHWVDGVVDSQLVLIK